MYIPLPWFSLLLTRIHTQLKFALSWDFVLLKTFRSILSFLPVCLSQALHIVGTPLRQELQYTCQMTLWWLPFFSAESKQFLSRATGNVLQTKAEARSLEWYTLFFSLLQSWRFAARGWRLIWILGMAETDAWKRFGRTAGWNRV